MKMPAPTANGVATIADKKVTPKDPTIIGNAPTSGFPWASLIDGFHTLLLKNDHKLILF